MIKQKWLSLFCTAAAVMFFCAGCTSSSYSGRSLAENAVSIPEISYENLQDTERNQVISRDVNVSEKPEITHMELNGFCTGDIEEKASINDYYPGNVLISNTVGIIGPPIQVDCNDGVRDPELCLTYSREELRGVPEKNIAVMYVEEDTQEYSQVTKMNCDTEKQTVTFPVENSGVYLLFDIYEYGSAMGWRVSEYVYEKDVTDYVSDWERERNTGDIMKLADKEWAKKNAPDFHVTTPEQLASVVYYSNVVGGELNIYLDADIDLDGYNWSPMGWNQCSLSVNLHGQNHQIDHLTIDMPDEVEVGLTGYAANVAISDLTLNHISVRGLRYVGILCGECHGEKRFNHLNINGSVKGDAANTAALVGSGRNGIYNDCVFYVDVNGERSEYHSTDEKITAENSDESIFTLSVNEQGQVQRTQLDSEDGCRIQWVIKENGVHKLSRGAENETVIPDWVWDKIGEKGKTYSVYMEMYSPSANGYIIASNTIDFQYQ